jgi:hypothetical protein
MLGNIRGQICSCIKFRSGCKFTFISQVVFYVEFAELMYAANINFPEKKIES